MEKEKDFIYILGHRHPDTDSIVSALAYATLKQTLGIPAIACRLGDINAETEYLLTRFQVEQPLLLKDSRASLDEIEMDEPLKVHLDASIKDVMEILTQNRRTLAVVDDRDQLVGIVSNSNVSHLAMGDTAHTIELLQKTSIERIARAVNGECLYKPSTSHFNGKTSIIAIAEERVTNYELTNRLVILGNDKEAQLDVIDKGAAVLVLVWTDVVDPEVLARAQAKDCAIILSAYGSMNTSRYVLFSPSIREIMTTDLVTFNKNEFVSDVGRKMLNSRYRAYPVIDDDGKVYGFISRYHILNSRSKRLILVDHNERSQSVEGLEEAEILEIIDHHRIGDISTLKPIVFRNEVIGSTASIIAKMFAEHEVAIPKALAALLLGAIISDTLNLTSPTTTDADIAIAKRLETLAELDRNALARDIYRSSSNLKNMTPEEIINQDIKKFYISDQVVMVSQVVVYDFTIMANMLDDLEATMDAFVMKHGLDLLVVVFTSITDHSSVLRAGGKLKEAVFEAFPTREEEILLPDIVSRKNQIIPKLSQAINDYVK